mgnify:CR=1 FL=1
MAIKNKRKDPQLYTYDKYECWYEDHASDCQWKSIKEAEIKAAKNFIKEFKLTLSNL